MVGDELRANPLAGGLAALAGFLLFAYKYSF